MTDLYKHISSRLKALRKERGWSLDKTSEKTGVSKAMLGQIEREESSPTIATLWKIAKGFETSFSSFIAESTGSLQELHPSDEKLHVATLLAYDEATQSEVFLLELLPGIEHLSGAHQTGVIEDVLVVDGSMEVLIDGEWRLLQKGQGIRFTADKPHGYRNTTSAIARIHNIVHYPE